MRNFALFKSGNQSISKRYICPENKHQCPKKCKSKDTTGSDFPFHNDTEEYRCSC